MVLKFQIITKKQLCFESSESETHLSQLDIFLDEVPISNSDVELRSLSDEDNKSISNNKNQNLLNSQQQQQLQQQQNQQQQQQQQQKQQQQQQQQHHQQLEENRSGADSPDFGSRLQRAVVMEQKLLDIKQMSVPKRRSLMTPTTNYKFGGQVKETKQTNNLNFRFCKQNSLFKS